MMYDAKAVTQEFTENITLTDNRFGAWFAANTGTADVSVYGYVLEPGQGMDMWANLPPYVRWTEPIPIKILGAGGKVRLQRILFKQVKSLEVSGLSGAQIGACKQKGL